jgi:hypothetical protein
VPADLAEDVRSALDETFCDGGKPAATAAASEAVTAAFAPVLRQAPITPNSKAVSAVGSSTASSSAFQIIPYATEAVKTFVVIFEAGVGVSDASPNPMSTPPPGGSTQVRDRSAAGTPNGSVRAVSNSVITALG